MTSSQNGPSSLETPCFKWSRRKFLMNLATGAVAGSFISRFASAEAEAGSKRPNVLIILADDLGWGDVSLHGCRDVATRHWR